MYFASRKGASVGEGALSMPCCCLDDAFNNTGKHELGRFCHWHLVFLKLGPLMLTLIPCKTLQFSTVSFFVRLSLLDLKF